MLKTKNVSKPQPQPPLNPNPDPSLHGPRPTKWLPDRTTESYAPTKKAHGKPTSISKIDSAKRGASPYGVI